MLTFQKQNLDKKSKELRFVGYSQELKGYWRQVEEASN